MCSLKYMYVKKNAKWKVVPARNSGWKKKSTYMNHNLPGGV